MIAAASRAAAVLAVALASVGGLAACGSDTGDGGAEAQEIVEELQSLREGEIVIKGRSSPRVYGPYVFRRLGYDVRFEHGTDGRSPGRLVVAVQSRRGAAREPYQLVVDSTRPTGTRRVTVRGRLYVHVQEARGEYVLRFTPH